MLHYYKSVNTKVFPSNITVSVICRPSISHCYGNIFGRAYTSWEKVQTYAWRADHIHYIRVHSCFMILDLFSYVTFKIGESISASVTCSSFTECGRCNKYKRLLISSWKNVKTNWLSSCDTLAWAKQISRHFSFFWVRPQWRRFLRHCRQERYLPNTVNPWSHSLPLWS